MAEISCEELSGYLDDALGEAETAKVEQALRESEDLRRQLRTMIQERDRGEHSLGAIWRRQRLSCPGRDQLRAYLMNAIEPALKDYIDFHLETIGCSFCQANVADLQSRQKEPAGSTKNRRQRLFDSSVPYLEPRRGKRT